MTKHNHLAVVITILAHQAMGFVWYSSFLFGSAWVHGQGKQMQDLNPAPLPFVVALIASAAMCYVISWLTRVLKVSSFKGGVGLGTMLWLGLGLPVIAMHYAFLGISWQVGAIDALYSLALASLAGGIIAVWRKPGVAPTTS